MGAVQDWFTNLPTQAGGEKTAGMKSSYLFDIDGLGRWKVDIDDGTVNVREGAEESEAADATIAANEETFAKIVAGEQNATSAYMTGKLKIRGDMGAAMKLQKLF